MNQTAQGLAALGRGPDTMLVHMAPEEVAGLQALALKHGGTLTVNPETGLAEAGFLKNILPMVAGFALGPAGFGLSSAMAGLTVGGITALTSKSLEKGLMAGLGAYGGAGLGEGFMGLGGAGAGAEAKAASELAGTQAGLQQNAITKLGVPSSVAEGTGAMSFAPKASTNILGNAASVSGPMSVPVTTGQLMAGVPQVATATPLATTPTFFDNLSQAGRGFNAATSSSDAALAFAKANKMPLGALGIAALSGSDDKNVPTPSNPGLIRPYTYARTKNKEAFEDVAGAPFSSRERQYFNDQYTAQTPYRAPGPEYMAVGGPVEDMSNGNDMAAYMGQDKFDQGGSVGGYAFDPKTGRYTSPGGRTSVGGYTYDPKTGLYTRPGGQGATTVPPKEMASGDSGSSGGSDAPNYVNPNVAKETLEEQSARNQKLNDFLTNSLMPVFSPFSTIARGLLDTPFAGRIANTFSPPGPVNYEIPVEDAVPKSVEQINAEAMQQNNNVLAGLAAAAEAEAVARQNNNVLAAPLSRSFSVNTDSNAQQAQEQAQAEAARQAAQESFRAGEIAQQNQNTPSDSGGGYNSGDYGGYSGSETQSSGESYANAKGGLMALAQGGMSNLGDYSDGGRLLRGPGDGVSDSIPAMIGQKQKARLADGEFVIPARIVSELGNGSTEAGARQLYAMMDRVQKARRKTIGKDKVATNSRAAKLLPA